MKVSVSLWIIAAVITLAAAAYQRRTGPTHPAEGTVTLGGRTIAYRFERAHPGAGDHRVAVRAPDAAVRGSMEFMLLGDGEWTSVPMRREGEWLVAELPHQPPLGKIAYQVTLAREGETATLPAAGPAVIRFRGDVPPWLLVPHILFMFGAMLFSTRAGLEAFRARPALRGITDTALVALFIGGVVLGAIVLKHAFGLWWTGFPFGDDPTDNKTTIALLGWIAAAWAVRRVANPKPWVIGAAVLMLAVFSIPHSVSVADLTGKARPLPAVTATPAATAPQETPADAATTDPAAAPAETPPAR
uniref:Uncharacterized protein n=1 Tax=Eiseniibacteriota bacterium TaxID=2212470 RepID=A0A832I0Y4_UNCEI